MRADPSAKGTPRTLTDYLRVNFQHLLDPVGAFLNRIGINPNTVTLIGLAGNLVGAIFLAQGRFLVGGLIVWLMGPIDALDGVMARLKGEPSDFGAFVDSVTDRYSELTILGGLLIYYLIAGDPLPAALIFAAASGSVLVSYVRARGEALGFTVKGGVLTRVERYLVLGPTLVFNIPLVGITIIAILANVTALQRILIVRKQAREQMKDLPHVD
ncbi:MAG: CDP-alcohol phosphatidyltransferase family protein [Anaerolineales bacterium]